MPESVLCYNIASVWQLTLELFDGDITRALKWFHGKNIALDNKAPIEIASQNKFGAQRVVELIHQLENGVFV